MRLLLTAIVVAVVVGWGIQANVIGDPALATGTGAIPEDQAGANWKWFDTAIGLATDPTAITPTGRFGAQFIFGTDDRWRITPTTPFPARTISFVSYTDAWGLVPYRCSASFIGSRVLLTAAHCLYQAEIGGWVANLAVYPGRDGGVYPYGGQLASAAWVPSEWQLSESMAYDYGLILLSSSTLGDAVGWFTIGALSDSSLMAPTLQPMTGGYPGDKTGYYQWAATDTALVGVTSTRLQDRMDIWGGQSGSPVWRYSDGLVIGVVSAGVSSGGIPLRNESSRITTTVINKFLDACGVVGCTFAYWVEFPTPTPTRTPTITPTPTQTRTPTATPCAGPASVGSPIPRSAASYRLYLPITVKGAGGGC